VNITLFGSGVDDQVPAVVKESLGMAVLDSGCSKTVVGTLWLYQLLWCTKDVSLRQWWRICK